MCPKIPMSLSSSSMTDLQDAFNMTRVHDETILTPKSIPLGAMRLVIARSVITPLLARLVKDGVLPEPVKGFEVRWGNTD